VITGFNTDVEHEGVVYHVQTEDKGLDSPLILSLVYVGGAILASKRSRYDDLIASGFDEAVLTERLNRQHRLICAAIKAGRIEELKRMGAGRESGTAELSAPPMAKPAEVQESAPTAGLDADFLILSSDEERFESSSWNMKVEEPVEEAEEEPEPEPPPPPDPAAPPADAYMVFDSRRRAVEETEEPTEGLCLSIMDEQEFRAGEPLRLGVVVTYRTASSEKPVGGVPVSVKILGTNFRPVIVSVKTERDGVALISAEIPRFTSGRAAILLRASKGEDSVEIRRVVRPA
jgi:hypothetical protein